MNECSSKLRGSVQKILPSLEDNVSLQGTLKLSLTFSYIFTHLHWVRAEVGISWTSEKDRYSDKGGCWAAKIT